jgi:lipopolysaccharide assembly protein A
MRWVHLTIIIVFAAVTVILALQNLGSVSVSFLSWSLRVPLILLVVIVYVLGAVTGGSLLALLRRSYEGSRRVPAGGHTH